jgi:hypothetical protein
MSGPPFDIVKFFDPDDEDDLKIVQVMFGQEGGETLWVDVPEPNQMLDSTLLVVWFQRGVNKIAVQHEERTVEFDLRGVIARDGTDNPTERLES